jgi:hypothetical protein
MFGYEDDFQRWLGKEKSNDVRILLDITQTFGRAVENCEDPQSWQLFSEPIFGSGTLEDVFTLYLAVR